MHILFLDLQRIKILNLRLCQLWLSSDLVSSLYSLVDSCADKNSLPSTKFLSNVWSSLVLLPAPPTKVGHPESGPLFSHEIVLSVIAGYSPSRYFVACCLPLNYFILFANHLLGHQTIVDWEELVLIGGPRAQSLSLSISVSIPSHWNEYRSLWICSQTSLPCCYGAFQYSKQPSFESICNVPRL